MSGFDSSDPASDDHFGYRADAIRSGIVSYNGFQFPPALKAKVTVVPEYDESQRILKYLTVALQIEFILTNTSLSPWQIGEVSPTVERSQMDTIVKDLRKRLSQPGQSLIFTAQGFGEFKVNISGGIADVDFGPKPQVLEWEPLGGSNAARVEWLCTTRIPGCNTAIGQFVQFNYTLDWGIDPAGFMLRSIEGSAEFPKKRLATSGDEASNFIEFAGPDVAFLQTYLLTLFPYLPNFKRQHFYRLSKDRKKVDFKIEDLEVRSDNLFFPGVADVDISQSVTSSLDEDGFAKWKIIYTGRVEVLKGTKSGGSVNKSKAFAWVYIGKLLQQKRTQFENVLASNLNNLTSDEIAELGDLYDFDVLQYLADHNYQEKTFIYPVHFSVTDNLYSNSFSFSVAYVGVVTSSLLAQGIGLFQPIILPNNTVLTNVKYITTYGSHIPSQDPLGGKNMEAILDLCHPVGGESASQINLKEEKAPQDHNKIGEPILSTSSVDETRNWTDYRNDITFYESSGTVVSIPLSQSEEISNDHPRVGKEEEDIKPLNQDPKEETSGPEVSIYKPVRGKCYVRMKGHGVRLGSPVAAPRLLGVGPGVVYNTDTKTVSLKPVDGMIQGAIAHQHGKRIVQFDNHRTNIMSNGKLVIKYRTDWELWYVLDRVPATGQVVTQSIPTRAI